MLLLASGMIGVFAGLAFYGAWHWVEASWDRVSMRGVGAGPRDGGRLYGRLNRIGED